MRLEPEDILAYIAAVAAHPAYTERFLEQLRVPGVRVPLSDDRTLWAQAIRLGRRVLWLHTYGERCIDPAADQPEGPPRLPQERRFNMVEVPDTEAGMPAAIAYDPKTQTLHVGTGRIWPVPPEVWAYEISGWRVVKRWFDYRKRNPRGRRSSELDDVVRQRWTPTYTTELLNLLQVLSLLIGLQPDQAALLDRICAGPQITTAELQTAAVIPPPPGARRPLIVEGATLLDQHA